MSIGVWSSLGSQATIEMIDTQQQYVNAPISPEHRKSLSLEVLADVGNAYVGENIPVQICAASLVAYQQAKTADLRTPLLVLVNDRHGLYPEVDGQWIPTTKSPESLGNRARYDMSSAQGISWLDAVCPNTHPERVPSPHLAYPIFSHEDADSLQRRVA